MVGIEHAVAVLTFSGVVCLMLAVGAEILMRVITKIAKELN